MTAEQVLAALLASYRIGRDPLADEWAAIPEFSLVPGGGRRRIDLAVVRSWGGKPRGHERHAIEIKVARSDWRKELASPAKRAEAFAWSHRFYFAAPAGLIDPAEVPDDCGLYVVDAGHVTTAKRPLPRVGSLPNERTFVEAFRRASRAEHRIRSATAGDPAAAAQLRLDLDAARTALQRRDETIDRERRRTLALLRLLADVEVYCECGGLLRCGKTVRWRHVDDPPPDGCFWARPDLDRLGLAE